MSKEFTEQDAAGLAEKLQGFYSSLPEGEQGLLAWMISAASSTAAENDEVVPFFTLVELLAVEGGGPKSGVMLLLPAIQKVREAANRPRP